MRDATLPVALALKIHRSKTEEMLFSDDLLEHVLKFVTSHKDRNAVSLVCKAWNKLESRCRQCVFIGNCYAVSSQRVAERFPRIKSVTLKGKPRFADFDLLPANWGAYVYPWVETFSKAYPFLEELQLKRMTVSDESLELISLSFPRFRVLVLTTCDGFSTDGLAAIARNCKHLSHLDLAENTLTHSSGSWLNAFPETCDSLVSLNFENLDGDVDFITLERLVTKCTALQTLKLNRSVSLVQLQPLLSQAPQLIELGTGSFFPALTSESQAELCNAFRECTQLQSLSGFWNVAPDHLPVLYPVCSNLLSLNLSYSPITDEELASVVSQCKKLRRLWLMDSVEDTGLRAVASACQDLRDLRVYPAPREGSQGQGVSEDGLVSISEGCPNLSSILYFCGQMTNVAVKTMAKNCPALVSFRLCILEPNLPDHVTQNPMDDGFGAIVENCKNLLRLSVSGLLTNRVFEYIGTYGKCLERLSVAFAGEDDMGMRHVLRGCTNLRILEIRDSPFGDTALLSGFQRYESMRSLWMSNCSVTLAGCSCIAKKKPRLNVEITQKIGREPPLVESLYVYRSVAGPRTDMPPLVVAL